MMTGVPASASARWFWLATAGLLALLAAAQVTSILQETQNWDEAIELATGYRYLKTGEYRFHIEHPPLSEILAALPVLALKPALPDGPLDD